MGPDALAQNSVHMVGDATGASAVFVYLWDSEQERLVLRVATPGPQHEGIGEIKLRLGEGLAGWVALRQESVVLGRSPRGDPRFLSIESIPEDEFNSMLAVPIVDEQGQLRGVFALYSTTDDDFGQDELAIADEVGQLLGVGLVLASTMAAFNQQSANARFLLDFPVRAKASLVPALHYSATRILDTSDAEVSLLSYISKQGDSNPPVTVGIRHRESQRHRVWSSHSPAAVQSARDEYGSGMERATVPLGIDSARGELTLFRHAQFRATDLEHIRAVAAQLSVLLESIDVASASSSHVTTLLLGHSDARMARTLKALDVVEPVYPVAFRVIDAANDWDATRNRMRELFSDAAGTKSIVLTDSISGVILADASRGRTSKDLAVHLHKAVSQLRLEHEARVTVGIGPISPTPEDFRAAMAHAESALDWSSMINRDDSPVTDYAEIRDVERLPTLLKDLSLEVVTLAGGLAPLAEYDRRHNSELAKTLSTFARFGGSASSTARFLVIHRNTLRQRLQRIEQLAEMDISDTSDWLTLALASGLTESVVAAAQGRRGAQ